MIHPYEMTALEDPAEIGSELPPGGGRIQMPGGDVRSFQFEIPAGSDSPEARRQAALQDMQFDIQKRNAEEAALDEQSRIDMLANIQSEHIQKAMEAGERYRTMRRFKRDIDDGMAMGLDKEQATIQSAIRNMGEKAAPLVNALRPVAPPTFGKTDSGRGYSISGTGRTVRYEPDPIESPEEGGISAAAARPIAIKQSQANRLAQRINYSLPSDPDLPTLKTNLATLESEIRKMSGDLSKARQPIAPPASVATSEGASGPIHPFPKSKADLEANVIYEHPKVGLVRWNGVRLIPVQSK